MFWRPEDGHSVLSPSHGSHDLNSGYRLGSKALPAEPPSFPPLLSFYLQDKHFTAELSLQPPPINHILMPDGVELVSDIFQTNETHHYLLSK